MGGQQGASSTIFLYLFVSLLVAAVPGKRVRIRGAVPCHMSQKLCLDKSKLVF